MFDVRWMDRWFEIKHRVELLEGPSGTPVQAVTAGELPPQSPRSMLAFLKMNKAALDQAAKLEGKKMKKRHKKTSNSLEASAGHVKKGVMNMFKGMGFGPTAQEKKKKEQKKKEKKEKKKQQGGE